MTDDVRLSDFDLCRKALDNLGVRYNIATRWETNEEGKRVQVDLRKLQNVQLPLTPEEWVSLVSKEGDHYIGGCCGNSSCTQDRVCHLFRFDSGWVGKELAIIASEVIDHDGEESPFHSFPTLFEDIETQGKLRKDPTVFQEVPESLWSPWTVMAAVWNLTKNHMSVEEPGHGIGDHYPPIRKAISVLRGVETALTWEHLFEKDELKNPSSQKKVTRAILLARFVPALDFVRTKIDELDMGEIHGFAVIDTQAGPSAIAENRRGMCIYETQAEVDTILTRWEEDRVEIGRPPEEIRERYKTRPVRVNRTEGIVFTDTNKVYEFLSETPEGEDV